MLTTVLCSLVMLQSPPAGTLTVKRVASLENTRVLAVAPAPTGSTFAAALEDRSVRLYNAANGQAIRSFSGHPDAVYGVAISPSGTMLATGDETARIWLWNLKTGAKLREFTRTNTHIRGIQNLSFSPDGKLLASTAKDDVIIIWRVADGKPVHKILGNGANFYSATFSPGGGMLLAPTLTAGLRFYRTSDFSIVKTIDNHGGQGALDIAVNPAGTLAVTAGRNAIASLVNLGKRERVNNFKGHQDWVVRAAISPNSRVVATSSSDRTVRLWNSKTFQTMATLPDQSAVGAPLAFTRDGKYLITASVSDAIQIYALSPSQGAGATTTKQTRRRR